LISKAKIAAAAAGKAGVGTGKVGGKDVELRNMVPGPCFQPLYQHQCRQRMMMKRNIIIIILFNS